MKKTLIFLVAHSYIAVIGYLMFTAMAALADTQPQDTDENLNLAEFAAFVSKYSPAVGTGQAVQVLRNDHYSCRSLYFNAYICNQSGRVGDITLLPGKSGVGTVYVIDCSYFSLCSMPDEDVIAHTKRIIEPKNDRPASIFQVPPRSLALPELGARVAYFNFAARIYPINSN